MKKRYIQYFVGLVLLTVPNFSSAQEYSHQQQVEYLGNIAMKMKELIKNDQILPLLQEIKPINTSGEFKDSEKLDTLTTLINNVVTNLDARIDFLKGLNNADDKKFKIKDNVIKYLSDEKALLQIMIPLYIKGIKYGPESLTDDEKYYIQKENLNNLNSERTRIESLLTQFQILHKISTNELKIFDL